MTDPVYVEPMAEPTDAELRSVADLAALQVRQEERVAQATTALAEAIRALRQTAEVDLPAALRAAGQKKCTTLSGPVSLEDKYIGTKLTSVDNPEGVAWVAAHGGGSLIKNTITLSLDREDRDLADELWQLLRAHRAANRYVKLVREESVHNMTMGSFVKGLVETEDVPLEQLGVTHIVRAKVGKTSRWATVELKGLEEK